MNVIIDVLSSCLVNFLNILVLLCIFTFIFTLLGTKLFGGQFTDDQDFRQNWDTMGDSFLNTFQVITLENWTALLYSAFVSNQNRVITMIYFLIWIFLGNYVLLNLFLAVLLDGFGVYGDELTDVLPDELHLKDSQYPEKEEISEWSKNVLAVEEDDDEEKEYIEYKDVDCEYSCWLFHKRTSFRKFMYSIYRHPWFDQLILTVIIISSFKLMVDTYFDQDILTYSQNERNFIDVMNIVDLVFNGIFIIEMVVKVISLGFVLELNSYLRNTWNQLDFLIVVFSIVDMSLQGQDLAFLKIVRMLRILRPLRFISHNPSMKILVNSLIESLAGLANVSIVIILIW